MTITRTLCGSTTRFRSELLAAGVAKALADNSNLLVHIGAVVPGVGCWGCSIMLECMQYFGFTDIKMLVHFMHTQICFSMLGLSRCMSSKRQCTCMPESGALILSRCCRLAASSVSSRSAVLSMAELRGT